MRKMSIKPAKGESVGTSPWLRLVPTKDPLDGLVVHFPKISFFATSVETGSQQVGCTKGFFVACLKFLFLTRLSDIFSGLRSERCATRSVSDAGNPYRINVYLLSGLD